MDGQRRPFAFGVDYSSLPSIFRSFNSSIYVLPLKSRPGGLLLAIPAGVIAEDTVLDALLSVEEQEVLGPSTSFDVALIGKDEQGEIAEVGASCKILVIDLFDAILEQVRDYDPVTDAFENILPFDRPQCIFQVSSIADALSHWIESMAFERLNFYSAREELPSLSVKGVAAKKTPAAKKAGKVITAMLADQVAALSAQMKMISQQYSDFQKATSPGFAKGAGGARGTAGSSRAERQASPCGSWPTAWTVLQRQISKAQRSIWLCGGPGTECPGRELVSGLHHVADGGTSSTDLCRSDGVGGCNWLPFLCTDPSFLGSYKLGLHQRVGGLVQPEVRDEEGPRRYSFSQDRSSKSTKPKAQAKVSEEAKWNAWGVNSSLPQMLLVLWNAGTMSLVMLRTSSQFRGRNMKFCLGNMRCPTRSGALCSFLECSSPGRHLLAFWPSPFHGIGGLMIWILRHRPSSLCLWLCLVITVSVGCVPQ